MATPASPIYYSSGFQNFSDPRKLAANQRQLIAQKGDVLEQQAEDQYRAGNEQAGQQEGYLAGIEDPLAKGLGGYNPSEIAQIQYTPQDVQNIVNRAATTSGAATAAGADAATRAANASGGNPNAVAAYRARAAQQAGAAAGDAATTAQVAAKQAQTQAGENIGQTRIGQQNQGLNYYQGLQQQKNQNAQNAANRQAGIYGTETSGTNQASDLGFKASQTPTGLDKIIGGIAGAASAFLDDGSAWTGEGQQPTKPYPAVVAEGGPEAVVKMAQGPYKMLEDGGSGEGGAEGGALPTDLMGSTQQGDDSWSKTPFWKQMAQNARNNMANRQGGPPTSNGPASGGFNPVSTYQSLGSTLGGLAKTAFAEDGEMFGDTGAIFTKPTQVMLDRNEAAVPLNYRPNAKTRPSMAMPVVNQIQHKRMNYGGARG